MSVNVITQGLLLIVTARLSAAARAAGAHSSSPPARSGRSRSCSSVWVGACCHRAWWSSGAPPSAATSMRIGSQPHRGDAVGRAGGAHHDHRLCHQRPHRRARRASSSAATAGQAYLGMGDPYPLHLHRGGRHRRRLDPRRHRLLSRHHRRERWCSPSSTACCRSSGSTRGRSRIIYGAVILVTVLHRGAVAARACCAASD